MGTVFVQLSFAVFLCAVVVLVYPRALRLSHRAYSVAIWLLAVIFPLHGHDGEQLVGVRPPRRSSI